MEIVNEMVPYMRQLENHTMLSLRDLKEVASVIAESGIFGIKDAKQALVLMLISQAEGRPAVLAARDYDIINGKPAKTAQAMHRDFVEAKCQVDFIERTDDRCWALFAMPGVPKLTEEEKAKWVEQKKKDWKTNDPHGWLSVDWDIARAKKAGLSTKDMYSKYTRQMLSARVISEGVRAVYPAATSGMYVPEEVREFDESKPARNVTPLPMSEEERNNIDGNTLRTHDQLEAEIKKIEQSKIAPLDKAHLEQLKIAVKKVGNLRCISDDEATVLLFDDESGKMTYANIDKLHTVKQLEKVKQALAKSTTILLSMNK